MKGEEIGGKLELWSSVVVIKKAHECWSDCAAHDELHAVRCIQAPSIRHYQTSAQNTKMRIESAHDTERRSLDTELGRRLVQLSSSAKFAVSLNQISHVAIRAAYNREEHGTVVTVYVVDIFLQRVQKGLPMTSAQNERLLKKREKLNEPADYQVEHRYSSFRLLRRRILDVVDAPSDPSQQHPPWCAYCSRVRWLVTAGDFPSRYLSQGPVAIYTGWRQLLMHSRKHGLERFVNELVTAVKDVSYCYTAIQCERYAAVSSLVNDFLGSQHFRSATSSTALSCS